MAIKSDEAREVMTEEPNAGPAPPSYDAVAAVPKQAYPQINPYPSTSSSNPIPTPRHPGSLEQGIYYSQSHPFHHGQGQLEWTPPQTEQEARARTRKRFLIACLWAFGVYLLIGLLLGGGMEDSSNDRPRRKHQSTSPYPDAVDHPSRTWKHVDRTSTAFHPDFARAGAVETAVVGRFRTADLVDFGPEGAERIFKEEEEEVGA